MIGAETFRDSIHLCYSTDLRHKLSVSSPDLPVSASKSSPLVQQSRKVLLQPLRNGPRASECAVAQKTRAVCQERTQPSLLRASDQEQPVQQHGCLQVDADHINSTVNTVSDFDALGLSSLLTASDDDSSEGKKIRVKLIFDPRLISTTSLFLGVVDNFCLSFLAYLCCLDFLHDGFAVTK